MMAMLLKNNDMAGLVGMTPPAFAKAVRTGRFTVAGRDERGHALFDPDVVVPQYESTAAIAELQNHARHLPEDMRGGRPRGGGGPEDSQQTDLFNANGLKTANDYNESRFSNDNETDKYLKVKLAKEAAQAKLLAHKLEMQTGELVRKTDVNKQGVMLGEIFMGAVTSWPSRLAPELKEMSNHNYDVQDYQARLAIECNNLILEMRNHFDIYKNKKDV